MKRWACVMAPYIGIWVCGQSYIGWRRKLYRFGSIPIQLCDVTYIRLLLRVGRKVVDECQISSGYVRGSNIYVRGYLDLYAWSLRLRAQTEKSHYVKALFSLREQCFFLRWIMRNTRDKTKGLRVSSERYIGDLGAQCLSSLNRGQDSRQQSHEEVGLCLARHPIPICHYIPPSKPPKNKPLQENKINQYWYI